MSCELLQSVTVRFCQKKKVIEKYLNLNILRQNITKNNQKLSSKIITNCDNFK